MAIKTFTTITSDLSDAEDATTVQFGLDGASYEIDLTDKERKQLEKALEPYLNKARKATTKRSKGTSGGGKSDAAVIREWAKQSGYQGDVPPRGRIPNALREAYEAAK